MSIRLFLSELKRRQVYRAVIVYATIAWVLLEGADIVFPRLGFADESVTLVLILAIVGFPIAVYLAWVYDITPDGIFRTPPLKPGEHHHFSASRIGEFLLIGALVAGVGYLYLDRLAMQKRMSEPHSPARAEIEAPDPAQFRSIAVLPFDDMSKAGDHGWFAEGIAEELLHSLAEVDDLRVMARTSSFAFKDTDKTIAEIAEILNVQAVLEGSVRHSGDRVRITAQLVDAGSGYHIWSESYESRLDDIFELQDELARAVVQALRIELGVDAARPLVVEQTENLEAYNWFLRGRALLDWSDFKTSTLAISYFEKAVEADPDYAIAWGHLALARLLTVLWQPFEVASPATILAYEKALALDPGQPEALAAKAFVIQINEHDWETAGKLYQRARNMRKYTTANVAYAAFYLVPIGSIQHAIQLYVDAEKLDPLHAGYKANLARILLWNGDPEAAIRKAREALELNPEHFLAISWMAQAYVQSGNCPAATEFLHGLPVSLQQEPWIKAIHALCSVTQGDTGTAVQIYRDLVQAAPFYRSNSFIWLIHLALSLGEIEEAIDLMERAVENKSWNQFFFRLYFRHDDAFKDHPRFLALLKRVGMDDESVAALHRNMSFD